MQKPICYFAVVLLMALGVSSAVGAPVDEAAAVARAYSRAVEAGDCAAMATWTSAEVLRRSGGERKFRDEICPGMFRVLSGGDGTVEDRVSTVISSFQDERTQLFFIPNHRVWSRRSNTVVFDGAYVVYTSTGGLSWQIIDLACLNEKWVRAVAPHYDGAPPLPPIQVTMLP